MELKSNGKSSLDTERSTIDRLQHEIKMIFFRVTQLLLKEEESIFVSVAMVAIQFVQTTYILFNRQTYVVWQTFEVTEWLHKILGYVMLTPYFEMLSFQALVAMQYVCLGLVILALMLIFYLSYRLKSSFSWPVYILRVLVQLFLSILYLPIMDLFFAVIACNEG